MVKVAPTARRCHGSVKSCRTERGWTSASRPMGDSSAPACRSLLRLRRNLDVAEQLDLGLESDSELLERASAPLGDERDGVRRRGAAGVLDEVRVLRGDLGPAD